MNEPKVPPPESAETPGWVDSSLAEKEVQKWDQYDQLLKGRKHKNEMLWLACYGWIVAGLTIFFSILFVLSLGAWSWHYLMPADKSWLSAEQLSKIQSIIFSGSLGAIVTSVIKRQIDKH